MAGAVIENLSSRKLFVILIGLIIVEIAVTLIGGLYAPKPTQSMGPAEMLTCRQLQTNEIITPQSCIKVSLETVETPDKGNVEPDDVVFVGIIPPQPSLSLIRWFQYLLCFANIRIEFQEKNQVEDSSISLNFTLAYSDADRKQIKKPNAWTKFANTIEENRPLHCHFNHSHTEEYNGFEYDCDSLFIFQLGSVPHKRYLVNLKISSVYQRIGHIKSIELISITQTGGFTQVWLGLKTFLFISMIFPVAWFWRRIKLLARKALLIEKACFALGLSIIFVNLPVEFFTVVLDVPWMLLFTDLRQGFFYAVLFSFLVIFTGEHLMDQAHRNKLSAYRCHLSCIFVTSFALLAFDVAERGVQLVNPFGTVWSHPAYGWTLLVLGCVSTLIYFALLLYLVYKVFRSIRFKRRFILQDERAARFLHTVNRLKAMMLLTVVTAGLTIAFFFLEQKLDGIVNEFIQVKVEVASAFFFGVYGLWNVYVCIILFMYAPSHKQFAVVNDTANESEEQEMAALNAGETEHTDILSVAQQKERED